MTERIHKHGLSIAPELYEFAENEALQYTPLTSDDFWSGVAHIFRTLTPRNKELLATRAELQKKIDSWYQSHQINDNIQAYKDFLIDIDYIEPEPENFTISVTGIDEEIRTATGPQLVVPVLNARFALNAANARWGSLYDAFYGTDVISEEDGATRSGGYNPRRGAKVIDKAKSFLDKTFPLDLGSHHDVVEYRITDGQLRATLADGNHASLADASLFRGYQGEITNPTAILLRHNGLHVELQIDRNNPIGKDDPAGLKDILIESAITTIIDFEDSVAAVDAEDKVVGYRNWLGLNVGDLQETLEKNGKTIVRKLNPDRTYTTVDGSSLTLPGRSLLFVRNVGHLMTTDAIIDADGHEVYEGILDAIFTTLTALPGISPQSEFKNSRTGSIYIVKPKMHGSAEVEFSIRIFQEVEKLFGLPEKTIKIGIMDEERRTSINLKAAIKAAQDRVAFINTGFLDRTGDEIHTSLHAGPVVRKAEMKNQPWYTTYEDYNVEQGLHTGFPHKAQIGKGMWAKPDLMADLVKEKINHPLAGATTAWVPSPTAATLHALHYHDVDVFSRQEEIKKADPVITDRLLEVPLHKGSLSQEDKNEELDNNAQSILGYVVRWVDQGIGCSKVPDIHDIALMEDRATLRISSQILANWLYHGVITEDDVISSLKKMAIKVDKQNENDPAYIPMAPNYDDSIAFQAAKELILHGATQPSGYTEPILHQKRKQFKALHR